MSERFGPDALRLDAAEAVAGIAARIERQVRQVLNREGAVVGLSGGVDSSVVAALCVRALGPDRVLGVMMPERDSSAESRELAGRVAAAFGFETVVEELTPALEGLGCYRRRDEAIRRVFPEFTPRHLAKITIGASVLERDSINWFKLTIESPEGAASSRRLPLAEYLQIVASTNLKQRTRMTMLYHHAERLNRAVAGTGQKDEHELGFFVKYGDGGADFKPIAHLFKMQVYQLAEHLGVPEEIVRRTPTTDTYSAEVTQTEFFFGVPFPLLDLLWLAMERGVPAETAAAAAGVSPEQVERVWRDLRQKMRTTEYLRRPPLDDAG